MLSIVITSNPDLTTTLNYLIDCLVSRILPWEEKRDYFKNTSTMKLSDKYRLYSCFFPSLIQCFQNEVSARYATLRIKEREIEVLNGQLQHTDLQIYDIEKFQYMKN